MQDGWGDQTQGQVLSFRVDSCPIPPLTPVTDPEALRFEAANGSIFDNDPNRFHLGSELACMETAVSNAGGSYTRISAYRPAVYQQHLQELWDAWQLLESRREPGCEVIKQEIEAEWRRHSLDHRPASQSKHTVGLAFDLQINGMSPAQIDIAAQSCGLYRFSPKSDPNHFSRR